MLYSTNLFRSLLERAHECADLGTFSQVRHADRMRTATVGDGNCIGLIIGRSAAQLADVFGKLEEGGFLYKLLQRLRLLRRKLVGVDRHRPGKSRNVRQTAFLRVFDAHTGSVRESA